MPLQAPPPPALDGWSYLINFRPSPSLQTTVNDRFSIPLVGGNVFQPIENGYGPINLDYYPVSVSQLPIISGTQWTADELLVYLRNHFNDFIDTSFAEFAPYDADIDGATWAAADPTGAVVHIDMRFGGPAANPDDGTVVVSEAANSYWIFSTLWSTGDLYHPVSGNRGFGYNVEDDGSYTFYTWGADRVTTWIDDLAAESVFAGANGLWLSLQQGLANFVIANGGAASIGVASSDRYEWDEPTGVQPQYFAPAGTWN